MFRLGIIKSVTIGRKNLAPPSVFGDIAKKKQGNFTDYMRFFYLKDHPPAGGQASSSVRVTLRQDGSVVGHDDFYSFGLHNLSRPFGMPGRSNNSANRDDDQKACPDHSGFTGHFFEQEGDLDIYHAQARMYDPAIGRFLGVDAMKGYYPTINSYQYALNNPVLYTDPTGMYVVQRAYYSASGDVTAKVTMMNQRTVQRFEGAGLALGSLPVVGSGFTGAKMISQGFISQGDPAYRPGVGDYVSFATLGLGRLPKALNMTRKAIEAGVTGANIYDALSNEFLTEGVGRDLATFSLIAESSFAGGFVNMGADGTSLTLNSGLANVISENNGGLTAVENYLGNFMGTVSSIVQAIANGHGLSLTNSGDRQRVIEIYKEHQEIFDYIIGSRLN